MTDDLAMGEPETDRSSAGPSVPGARAVLDGWVDPVGPGGALALAYRPLAEAITGVACPLPISREEVERHVALARRNREYSAAHTDAMLPGDPPLLPGLLARAEVLDARERAAFASRLAERDRRQGVAAIDVEVADLRLARALRAVVRELPPGQAATLCLLHGLAGDRRRSPDEAARLLGTDADTVRRLEADGMAALREPHRTRALRDLLETRVAPVPPAYP